LISTSADSADTFSAPAAPAVAVPVSEAAAQPAVVAALVVQPVAALAAGAAQPSAAGAVEGRPLAEAAGVFALTPVVAVSVLPEQRPRVSAAPSKANVPAGREASSSDPEPLVVCQARPVEAFHLADYWAGPALLARW
jgi:hypothetical protein